MHMQTRRLGCAGPVGGRKSACFVGLGKKKQSESPTCGWAGQQKNSFTNYKDTRGYIILHYFTITDTIKLAELFLGNYVVVSMI